MDDNARRLDRFTSLRQLCHPDLDALFWNPERLGSTSAWWGHVPFAHWLMRAVRPSVFVELGTHTGVSYSAFCHAVERCRLGTRCYAVDTWKGDAHASFYDESVYQDFRAFHDERYAAFSTLLRCTFDEALARIAYGSVDLLHIDGLHTYEAVRHDFESWRAKLSPRGVVLLHDIDVHRDDFAVWRVWQELSREYPHFEFSHSCGLGIVAVGNDVPQPIAGLCAMSGTEEGIILRSRLAAIGERWMRDVQEQDLKSRLTAEHQARTVAEAARNDLEASARRINSQLEGHLASCENTIADLRRENRALIELAEMRAHRLDMIEQSTSWRATAVLRTAAARPPEAARLNLRRVAKGIFWALTPHRTPERIKFLRQRRQSGLLPRR